MPEPERWWGRHLHELRWQLEAARLLADPVFYGRGVPRGDGRPVLLLPGLLAGDYTLAPLAGWLARIGYRPAIAGFMFNIGCSERALQQVARRARSLRERHARRTASMHGTLDPVSRDRWPYRTAQARHSLGA